MIRSYLKTALTDGTLSWDNVIYNAAGITLLAATDCRVGEVVQDLGGRFKTFLAREAVTMFLHESN